MLSSVIFPLKLRIVLSDPFPMFLIFALFTSIMTFIRRIRIIAQIWVRRVIFPMLTTLFLLRALIFTSLESDDDDSDESDDDGSGYGFTSGSCFLLHF